MRPMQSLILTFLLLNGCAGLKNGWVSQAKPGEDYWAKYDEQKFIDEIASVNVVTLTKPYPETMPDSILIMTGLPEGKHVELAILDLVGTQDSDNDRMAKIIRYRAAKFGADALIKYEIKDVPVGSSEHQRSFISIGHGTATGSSDYEFKYAKKVTTVAVKLLK